MRVLVVDDSATVRAVLSRRLAADEALEVVGAASDGIEALQLIAALHPDVVTLDIEMPRLDGLGTLRRIMQDCPTRVVMVSSLTREGADATIRALELGAVDFIEKPVFGNVPAPHRIADEVSRKVREAATARLMPPRPIPGAGEPHRPAPGRPRRWLPKRVLIGASTGGPQALREVLTALPADLGVPIVVVQHMPAGFTRSLADRLNELAAVHIEEAAPGARLTAGNVLITPGDYHLTVDKRGVVDVHQGERECGVRPSVNVTAESMARVYGKDLLCIVLTGMGSDGTRGAAAIKAAGGAVIVESRETAVVWGMPRSVFEAGHADEVVPLHRVAAALVRACSERRAGRDG